ncbi:ribonuclease R [Planctomycetales bacterium]|nr:ribonuclease R [Planctomycetales bacterium]
MTNQKKKSDGDGEPLIGSLTITHSGCGFFVPDDSSLSDVYIGEGYLGMALDGDRVKIQLDHPSGHGVRKFGHVVEVVARSAAHLVATVIEGGRARPEDPKNPFDYKIIDPPAGLRVGVKVLLKTVVFPGDGEEPQAGVAEILGAGGEPRTEIAAILRSFQAPEAFPDAVRQHARQLLGRLNFTAENRSDLTDLRCCTIDPDDARDYDDALSFEPLKNGHCRVGIHIADVSAFVTPGDVIDDEAAARSTSIYLPDRVIPMLPEELSNEICSLRPNVPRYAKTVFIEFSPDGERKKYHLERSLIKSSRRLTYKQARQIIDDETAASALGDAALVEDLRGLHALAQRLRATRLAGGAIELNMREMQITFDEKGNATGLVAVENDFSHQLVEEFMLAANVAVAEWCKQNGLPVLHRQHEPPSDEAVADLAEFLSAAGQPFKPPFQRERLQKIIDKTKGQPEARAINLAVLKSFSRAVYGPRGDIGHFALNFPSYLHFTSPIRRYPDLHLHQMLDQAFALTGKEKLPVKLRQKILPAATVDLTKLGEHCSGRERRAMKIEEGAKSFFRLQLLDATPQREFKAVITGVRKFGIFVEIEKYFVEGMIPRWLIERKGFSLREVNPNARGADAKGFHLGQEVRVRVINLNLAERYCEFDFIGVAR